MLGTWGVQQTTRVHAAREHMQAVWISGVCGHSAGMPSSQLCWTGAPERHAVPALLRSYTTYSCTRCLYPDQDRDVR